MSRKRRKIIIFSKSWITDLKQLSYHTNISLLFLCASFYSHYPKHLALNNATASFSPRQGWRDRLSPFPQATNLVQHGLKSQAYLFTKSKHQSKSSVFFSSLKQNKTNKTTAKTKGKKTLMADRIQSAKIQKIAASSVRVPSRDPPADPALRLSPGAPCVLGSAPAALPGGPGCFRCPKSAPGSAAPGPAVRAHLQPWAASSPATSDPGPAALTGDLRRNRREQRGTASAQPAAVPVPKHTNVNLTSQYRSYPGKQTNKQTDRQTKSLSM